ncbi:hypothetical protein F2Q68_00041546 [Brassica cretica]|uniref:Copine C-terminal domain-containing protein n=1 Tax=Brassica cretica TaxID=69181 RepID=A0A8S9MCP0_BRACR|nr:hypothetical protein F2Q68_00041546 [Brassica cretica]
MSNRLICLVPFRTAASSSSSGSRRVRSARAAVFKAADQTRTTKHVVVGVDGILSAYSIACTDVAQSRPIQFSGVVNRAVDIVSASPHKKYYVLLIITTGAPTDMPATVEALLRGAELPLSVLIVSLGDADLAELENELFAQGGIRDFVKFGSLSDVIDGRLLTAIPKHFISHIRYKRIDPRGSFTDLEILPLL